jgi:hypothetical protein
MKPAKIVAIVIGALLILIGLGLVVPGSILLWINGAGEDGSGFFMTSDKALTSEGYALTTPNVDVNIGPGDWIPSGGVGTARIRITSAEGAPVFVGIGPADEVSAYLDGVAYDEVTNLGWFSTAVEYLHYTGGAPPSPPGQQTFWTAKQEGSGTQTLEWEVQSGNWTAVLMNADGTAPVEARVSLGAHFPILLPIGIGLTVAGVVLLAVGILLIVLGARRPRQPLQPAYPGAPQPSGLYQPVPGQYPQQPGQYPQQPGQYPPTPGAYQQQPYQQQPPYQQPSYEQPQPTTSPQPAPQPQPVPPPQPDSTGEPPANPSAS